MQKPSIPADERERLHKLHALDVIFSPASRAYDDITRLARLRFGTAFALVSLITEDQQWFKAADGLDACYTNRDISFCGHAIGGEDVFVVENATTDERFADNPLVTGPPGIRFYAGYPLRTGPGSALGTLCIIDTEPRDFNADDCSQLARFGRMVENLLVEREQILDLATQALVNKRGLSRWQFVEPITGDWTFAAAPTLVELTVQHALESSRAICALSIEITDVPGHEQLTEDPAARMILKEAARQLRAFCPPLSAHFHNGRGRLVSIALTGDVEKGQALGKSVIEQLQTPNGWDLVPCEPPRFRSDVQILSPGDPATAPGLMKMFEEHG